MRRYIYILIMCTSISFVFSGCSNEYPEIMKEIEYGEDYTKEETSISSIPIVANISGFMSAKGDLDEMVLRTYAVSSVGTSFLNPSSYLIGTPGNEIYGVVSRLVPSYPGTASRNGALYFYESLDAQYPQDLEYAEDKKKHGYNFYSCRLCDTEVGEPKVTDSSISYHIIVDGKSDVLYGCAPEMSLKLIDTNYSGDNYSNITYQDKVNIVELGGYSGYAANRNVNPQIDLKHAYARLSFRAIPGNMDCPNIIIDSIKVKSVDSFDLVVAASKTSGIGPKNPGGEKWFKLCDSEDETGYKQPLSLTWDEEYENLPYLERPAVSLGDALYLPSSRSYEMKMYLTRVLPSSMGEGISDLVQSTYTFQIEPKHISENYNPGDGSYSFKSNNAYNIDVVIFGREPLVIAPRITKWLDLEKPTSIDLK